MRQIWVSAVVAAVVSIAVVAGAGFLRRDEPPDIDQLAQQLAGNDVMSDAFAPQVLSYTMEPAEDAWVNGARTTGTDHRSLSDASHSICYLTKIQIKGIQSPEDSNSCSVSIDDFTGYWQLAAQVDEGGRSQVRCNARCLVWNGDKANADETGASQ